MLPPKIPRKPKRETRWRSQAHLGFVRSHACAVCGSVLNVQAAHVRLGSHCGMGQKPDDWRAVGLCGGYSGHEGCHSRQHRTGEETFWREAGQNVEILIDAYCRQSPRAFEIKRLRAERDNADEGEAA